MRVVVRWIVFCVTGIVASSLSVLADERLREADRTFNVGEFDRAFELYAMVRDRAKATRHQLLAAEALNSMAATELMRGRPARLDQLRRASILEKRQASGRSTKPRAAFLGRGRNLLVNGGFEAGFVLPWGSGHYERRQGRSNFGIWWNSGRARAFMKLDSDVRYSGNNALRMSSFSPSKAHVFATTAQRISGLKPNSIYRITMRIKAEQFAKSALSISVDAGWEKRLPAVPGGTYDWQLYSASINIGHNNYIDLRFIHQNVGTIWIDDIAITPESEYQASPGVLAEALENRAEYQQALEVYAQIEQRAGKPSTRLRVARARILTVLGRYDEALDLLLPLAQPQAGPWVREALGDLYSALGQHTLALDHYRAAATAIAGNQAGLARVRQRMGETYLTRVVGAATARERSRLRQNASRELSRALRIMRHIGERHGEARTLRSIAQLQYQSGAIDKARSIQQTARKLAAAVGDEVLVTDITLDLAEGALASGTRLPSVAVLRDVLGAKRRIGDRIGIIRALELLARAHKGKGEIEQAFDRFQAAAKMLGTIFSEVANTDSDTRRSLVDQFRRVLRGHIDAGFALHSMRQRVSDGIVNATFQMAQWAQFNAATAAISRMAARASAVTGDLADLARRRQDIESRLGALRRTFRTRLSQAADKRDLDEEQNLSKEISATLAELRKVDAELLERFPEYADLANPKPVSVVNVRRYLDADETLLFLLEVEDEAFAWLVTKDATEWFKLAMSPNDLKNRVLALRCGLDRSAWYDTGSLDCAQALGIDLDRVPQKYDPLPFDAGRAYTLYEALLGPAKRLIEGKHVFVVPSGALAALPFQVLVTSRPVNARPKHEADYAALAWLGKTNSLSVLPAAGSLVMLRAHAKASQAGRPFIGFGNPLLIGQDGRDLSAWSRTTCALAQRLRFATPADRGAVRSLGPMSDSGLANVEKVRRQPPLPETADELCAVARASGSVEPDRSVWLGARATESAVRKLSSSGELAGARIVHFATHGLLAGETATLARERAEPALMLTPPVRARVEDDGLLTASEVTTLKLDADWVILSACNTAAGDTIGGDAFSGLTRAFFYAGARALLVSHWYVNSQATVELVTHAFTALNKKPTLGRAEAMRRAIAHLVRPGSGYTHPEYWAPFVVVGEGGRGR